MAMFGSIMPAPFATPTRVAGPMRVQNHLGQRSVVMIARAKRSKACVSDPRFSRIF